MAAKRHRNVSQAGPDTFRYKSRRSGRRPVYKRIQKAGRADTPGISRAVQIACMAAHTRAATHFREAPLMNYLRIAIAATALASALLAYWPAAWTSTASAQESAVPAPDFSGADRWLLETRIGSRGGSSATAPRRKVRNKTE